MGLFRVVVLDRDQQPVGGPELVEAGSPRGVVEHVASERGLTVEQFVGDEGLTVRIVELPVSGVA